MSVKCTMAALLAIVAVTACSSGTGVDLTLPQTDANIVGTFNLISANGMLLPYNAVVSSTEVWELDRDQLTVSPGGSWVDTTLYAVSNNSFGTVAPKTTVASGTYVIANGIINFVMTSGGNSTFTGSVQSNTLTVNASGTRYVYSR